MKPPEVRWEAQIPGLHVCYIGDSEQVGYHFFRKHEDGKGSLYVGEEQGGDLFAEGIDLKTAEDYVRLDVLYKWMEENQHEWTRADK